MIPLDVTHGVWERFFTVAPLVVIGTEEEDGTFDFAPKHMALPLGWDTFFGFVCTDRHATKRNAVREGWFTVSFPRPDDVMMASLAAAPRWEDDTKPTLSVLPTVAATVTGGVLLRDAYLHLECELDRVVGDLGDNDLVIGRIVAARVAEDSLRLNDADDQDVFRDAPMLAYVHPGRYAVVDQTFSFPFHSGFTK